MRQLCFIKSVLFLFFASASFGQNKITGVYAGTESSVGINGMQSFGRAYYFRPDGTYCSDLGKPDWKTRVNGTYTISGKKLFLTSGSGGKPNGISIIKDDYLSDDGTSLFKFDVMNRLPAQSFSHTMASSVGGAGTGTPYAGSYGQNGLSFDGKGHFSHSGFGSSMVAGDNVGGGSTKEFGGDGTYTINESMLILNYNDGKVVSKSFFYSGDEPAMALINGSIYYAYEQKKGNGTTIKKQTDQPQKQPTKTERPKTRTIPVAATAVDGMSVLQKANLAHGGKVLDNLKTVRLQASVGTMNVTQLIDVLLQKIRIDFYQGDKLTGIEQLEGTTGWQWINGKITALSAVRIKEMTAIFNTGILALRSERLKNLSIQSAEVNEDGKMKTLTVKINGRNYAWIFDTDNRMAGEANNGGDMEHMSILKDFRSVNGIVLPFTTIEKHGTQSFTVNYSSIVINSAFGEKDWSKPE
jgi:hypothetical protein